MWRSRCTRRARRSRSPRPGPGPDLVIVELVAPYAFSPAEVTIPPGTTIRWVNRSDIFHTITPDGHSEWSEVEMFTAGEEFEHTFNDEGVFPYVCAPHVSAGMTGTITVESPNDAARTALARPDRARGERAATGTIPAFRLSPVDSRRVSRVGLPTPGRPGAMSHDHPSA